MFDFVAYFLEVEIFYRAILYVFLKFTIESLLRDEFLLKIMVCVIGNIIL